ncbi:hypothetical protein HPB48_017711 [Haemaphysalis longicornis]|uniref:3',5'-cyclic-AMP phosphodiesterase n=1 Tax=Haemaphysalis longicornis TaxID=44386 RepID=A0A9J6FX73_HAELO|nr:hypothetical protein HPB48_017711 [Haemaphysalis longicornis]
MRVCLQAEAGRCFWSVDHRRCPCFLRDVGEATVPGFTIPSVVDKRSCIALRHGEDQIVTPFAQILASLRSVLNNIKHLTKDVPPT